MAGLLDFYGGGGSGLDYTVPFAQQPDPQRQQRGLLGLLAGYGGGGDNALSLYGDALSDPQKAALQQRGLLGFLGAFQKSGALDYTAPFLDHKMPASFASGMAAGAAGMGEAQDAGALNAMRANLLGLQGQELRGKLGLYTSAATPPPPMYASPQGASPTGMTPSTAGPSTAAPGGLLPALGMAVEGVESGGKADAVSPKGAIGVRQIMPSTAADYGVTDKQALFDPDTNRQLGDKILGDLYQRYNGNLDATLVAYNAGPKVADKFITAGGDPRVLPAETQAYLPKVKATLAAMQGGQTPGLLASFQGGRANQLPVQPAPQGLLPQMPGNAPAAPSGGLLAQVASGQPPQVPSPTPAASAAAPGGGPAMPGNGLLPALANGGAPTAGAPGMVPGGSINPAYVQWAQQQANARSALGVAVPGYMNEASLIPFEGPKAYATATGTNQSKLDFAPKMLPYEIAKEQAGPAMRGQQARETAGFEAGLKTNPYAFNYAPPKGNGPGYSEAAPTTDGFVVPPANQAAPIAGSTTSLEHDQKNWGDLQKEWMNARPSVEKGLQRIQDMADALRQVYTGQYVTDFAEWRAKIKGLTGVDFKTLPDPAQVERLLKDNFSTSVETMKSTGLSRWTQAELFSSQKNFANPDLQPEANLRILSQTAGTLDWERHMMDAFPRGKGYGWRDPIDFQTKFVAQPQNSLQGSVDRWYAKLGEGMQGIPQRGQAPQAAAPQQGTLPEGATAVGPNGHRIKNIGGQLIDMQTLKPFGG